MVRFPRRATAEAISRRLGEAGIAARVQPETVLARFWFVGPKAASVQVEVPEEDFERALRWLREWDAKEGVLRAALRCPECGSLRVEYPQVTEKSVLTNLLLGLAAELRLIERDFYCEDCHFTWPKQGTRARSQRPHLAPYYFIEGIEQTTRQENSPPGQRKTA